ncbi:MAG: hypothetical protein RSA97_07460, partial [Oscillospiraceae bacterium]
TMLSQQLITPSDVKFIYILTYMRFLSTVGEGEKRSEEKFSRTFFKVLIYFEYYAVLELGFSH